MPFYRFQIDSPLTALAVLQRVEALVRDAPGLWQSIKESFGQDRESDAPFIGKIDGDAFHLRRDIRYRNSFLPQINGRVVATPTGTRVFVTMHVHPLVGAFMLFWFGGVAFGTCVAFSHLPIGAAPTLIPIGMLVFGTALTLGAFYPEAFKARRLLEQGIGA
jgi:hypothetical protein